MEKKGIVFLACVAAIIIGGIWSLSYFGVSPLMLTMTIFDHRDLFLGLSALIALGLGTVLYEWNPQLTKAHAILVVTAFILTTVNVCLIIPDTIYYWGTWTSFASTNWVHLVHILVGMAGFGASVVAFVAGLSGSRTKVPGYVTLICWGFCFIYGIIVWGVNV